MTKRTDRAFYVRRENLYIAVEGHKSPYTSNKKYARLFYTDKEYKQWEQEQNKKLVSV